MSTPLPLLLALCLGLAPAPHESGPPQEAAAAAPAPPQSWAQWRGPSRDGHVAGRPWPDELTPERLTLVWRADDLGDSYATPVLTPTRVFTVGSTDDGLEVVRAFDRTTGEALWRRGWEGSMEVPFFAAKNGSWVRSSPTYDGDALYVAGMRDVLVCLDGETGAIRWRRDFMAELGTPLPAFGFVCSPLVTGEHVYVQAGAALTKLDKRTGETVWRALGDDGGADSHFSSPVLATLLGREQLVVLTRTTLAGVAPEDGAVLWSRPIEAFRGMNILTPLAVGDAVFTAPYGGRAQLLRLAAGEDDEVALEQAWTARSQGYMCSPVLVGGHLYYFARSNRFVCVDVATGEDAWISPPTGDEYWSLVAQGDRILALSDTGRLRLVAADPAEYRVLGEVEVVDEGSTWAHLAVADGHLAVRELTSLLLFEWR